MSISERLKSVDDKVIAAALAVAVLALVVALALIFFTGNDPEASAASGDGDAAPELVDTPNTQANTSAPSCDLDVNAVILAVDPITAAQFPENGLSLVSIPPAQEIAEGAATAPEIADSEGVRCDLRTGTVEMRGGVRFAGPGGTVDFMNLRMDFEEGEVYATFDPTTSVEAEILDLNIDAAQFTERGSIVSAVVPMILDEEAAVALNAAVGTDFLGDVIQLGTVRITGNRE